MEDITPLEIHHAIIVYYPSISWLQYHAYQQIKVLLWTLILNNWEQLTQPFWGKLKKLTSEQGETEKMETPEEGLLRELEEELIVDAVCLDVCRDDYFFWTFSAPSDIQDWVQLIIHVNTLTVNSLLDVSCPEWSEMSDARWYTFQEVSRDPAMWTLTRIMVASILAEKYNHLWAIDFLCNYDIGGLPIETSEAINLILQKVRLENMK